MNTLFLNAYLRFQALANREDGQGLVEYGLVIPMIAFGAIFGMTFLSAAINHALTKITENLSSAVT